MIFRTVLVAAILFSGSALGNPISDRAEVSSLIGEERWEDAVAKLEDVLSANPYHGVDWYYLGLAHARMGDCKTARPALERSLDLGVNGFGAGMRVVHLEAAACAASEGDFADALNHLSIAQARYKFSDFEGLGEDPRFARLITRRDYKRLAGVRDWSKVKKAAGWRADLDYFVDLVERRHPDPFHTVSEKAWLRAVSKLRRRIPRLSEYEIIAGFMRLAGMIEDGHTSVYPPFQGPRAFRLVPIWPYEFDGEWRIAGAAPDHAELAGARIVSVEGMPVDKAVDRIGDHLPRDNERTKLWLGNVVMQFAEIGAVLFGADDPSCLTLEMELISGERVAKCVAGRPIDRNPQSRWVPDGWAHSGADTPPLWLSRLGETFWFTALEGMDAVYAQINQIRDGDERSFAENAAAMMELVRENGATRLIIDLRHNNGGNGFLNQAFLHEIIRNETINREGHLFVIVGRRTFSAAQLLANGLETQTNALFVGEPTGSRPQFYGEDTNFTLPYSGLQGSISSLWFQNRYTSGDERPWIAPDLPAVLSFDDWRQGHDPALAAIMDYVQEINGP